MTPPHANFVIERSEIIESEITRVWKYVTNVDVTAHPHPAIFKALGVPRPLRAELMGSGVGSMRTAWFDNGKRFIQTVLEWKPPLCYRFAFAPDPGFRAGFVFDLSSGPFRILEGWYRLDEVQANTTRVTLGSRYFCSIHSIFVVPSMIRAVLLAYQSFLLRMIKSNCESGAR